jgi:hypothetical protein
MHVLFLRGARYLLQLAIDRALRQVLPMVFERIDQELPVLLNNHGTPAQVTGLFASAIADHTGSKATAEQVQAIVALYNPIAAAVRQLNR